MHPSAEGTSARDAGAVVVGLGLVLASVHAVHAAAEVSTNLPAVFYGSLLPFTVAVGVAAGGVWIDRREWIDISPWRLVGWCGAGAVVTLLLAVLLVQYQVAEGSAVEHWEFVNLMFVTYGAGIGLVVGVYDVRIREAQARLAEKTRRLDEFASIVSHDLRNPLNVAQGYVELAEETGNVSDLELVADAHDRMDAILADMLALAKGGDEAISPTTVHLAAAAEDAWAMVDTGDATLTVSGDVTLSADPGRLKTLFENLFRNSVEHGSTGSEASETPRATGEAGDSEGWSRSGSRPEADDGRPESGDVHAPVDVTVGRLDDRAGFYVEDTGRGIPPEDRERVFEAAFTTGSGSGLGLAIVRAAADAHGWSHALTESESGGARFEFRNVTFVDDD